MTAGRVALALAVLIGALAIAASALARPAQHTRHQRTFSTHLQVTEVEYRLLLSRGVVRAGPVSVQQIDAGMDPHDLDLSRDGSGPLITAGALTPGQRWDGVIDLRPGVYRLWCSLPQHAALGMHATLRVVR